MRTGLTFDDVQIIPRYSEIEGRDLANTETRFTRRYKLEIPLIASPMDTVCDEKMALALWKLGGVGVIHRFMSIEEQVESVEWLRSMMGEALSVGVGNPTEFFNPIAAAIGVNGDSRECVEKLLDAGVNVLVIDVAHGHHKLVKDLLGWLTTLRGRSKHTFDIVAGSVATLEAAYDLQDWGADALRVGVGGGSVCETRIRTGIGVPQLQAVIDINEDVLMKQQIHSSVQFPTLEIPVISDGGIRYPGDVAKALAAGADTVMIGSLFAGTDEAPGEHFIEGLWPYNREMRVYRGLASATTKLKYAGAASHVEGASKMIESRGSVGHIVHDIVDGLTSSMSYVGATNLEEFRAQSRFIQITLSGLAEAHPHLLR